MNYTRWSIIFMILSFLVAIFGPIELMPISLTTMILSAIYAVAADILGRLG